MRRYLNIGNLVVSFLVAAVAGSVCKLGMPFTALFGLLVFFFLPSFQKYVEKEKEAYARYTQACLYMEQMESSFRKNRRIYPSLKETLSLFPEGEMEETIQKAVDEIEKDDAMADASERALAIISEKYDCEQMELMHAFFLRCEEQGGDFTEAAGVLEGRRNAWMETVEQCRSEKKNMLFSVMGSLVLLFVVSEALVLFLPGEMSILEYTAERVAVLVETCFLLMMARSVLKKNASDWLTRIQERSVEEVEKDYRYIEEYELKAEMVKSLKWAILPLVVTAVLFTMRRSLVVLSVGALAVAMMLNQHKLDYSMKKKRIKREVERDFPGWMFYVILLLETESVQGAIRKSQDKVPASLAYPVQKLWEDLSKRPTSAEPYFDFLKDYDVPKVQEAMKLLYSISSGTGGDINEQMLTVIEKNNAMTIRSERIKNDNRVAGMMSYLFLPVIPSGVKIMADLAMVMMALYSGLGSMV